MTDVLTGEAPTSVESLLPDESLIELETVVAARVTHTVEHLKNILGLSIQNNRKYLLGYCSEPIDTTSSREEIEFMESVVDAMGARIVAQMHSHHKCAASIEAQRIHDKREGHENTMWYDLKFLFTW